MASLHSKTAYLIGLALAMDVATSGCGGSPSVPKLAEPAESAQLSENPTAPSLTNDAGTLQPPPDTATVNPDAPSPLASVLETDPAAVQKTYDAASAAPAAALKTNGITGATAVAVGLRGLAKKVAYGMQPDGPLAIGTLKEKAHLQVQVTLQPGKCYAVVGFSPKAKDIDLHLLVAPGVLVGQDTTDDNTPVIGRSPAPVCPATSRAVTYLLDVFADQGAGDVGVQLYSRNK